MVLRALLRLLAGLSLSAAAAIATPTSAGAQRVDLSHGRGFVWGASATIPIITTTVRYAEMPTPMLAPVVPPGGGVEARLGVELDSGFTIEIAAGIQGHAVDGQPSLVRYRAGAQLRMPIDLGGDVFPYLGAGVGLAIFGHGQSLATTLDGRGIVGLSWWAAPWFALDFHVSVDVTPPGFAFTDTLVLVSPAIGAALAY